MTSDVRIRTRDPRRDLRIVDGLCAAGSPSDDGPGYEPGAVVPAAAAREPTREELSFYVSDHVWPPCSTIGVVALPGEVVGSLVHAAAESRFGADPRDARAADRAARAWASLTNATGIRSLDTPQWLGFSHQPGRRLTTTVDGSSRLRVGLHIDSWDKLPLERRSAARVRLCVNLGQEDRFLIAAPHSVAGLLRIVAGENPGQRFCDPRRLVAAYAAGHAQSTLLQIRIAPGAAYIAPTENIVHDGASPGPASDLTGTWMGLITCASVPQPGRGGDPSSPACGERI
jgi:hypothetical protein